jgi:hypothetical protein
MSTAAHRPQSYANHRARVAIPYVAAAVILALDIARRAWLAFSTRDQGFETWGLHLWYVVLMTAILYALYSSRRRAQIVQDRVIRLEMRVRLERVLGAARRGDIERLTLKQLIALRFAGDGELPTLVDEVLAGRLSAPDDIKRRVKDWQADWLRV